MNGSGSSVPLAAGVPTGGAPATGRVPALVQDGWALGAGAGIVALFGPWLVLAGPARRVLLAIVLLDIPLQVDRNFGYRADAAEFGAVSGFTVSLTTIALAGLYLAWFLDRLTHRDRPARVPPGLLLPLAPFVVVSAASLVAAADVGLHARGMFLLVQMTLVYGYLVGNVRTDQDIRFVVRWLFTGLVLESLLILGLAAAGEGFQIPGLRARLDAYEEDFGGAARLGGTVGSPNNAAAYLEMLLAPALAALATRLKGSDKALALLGLAAGSAALVTTLSRGGWLAGGLSLAIVFLCSGKGAARSRVVPLVFVVFLATVALVFHQTIADRLSGEDRGAARSRLPLMLTAFNIIEDHPVLGVGANNYAVALDDYVATHRSDFLYTVHNQYLLVWAETGILGLGAFLWFLALTLRWGWRCWRRGDRLCAPLALGLTAALVGQMTHMHVDVFSTRPQVQLLVTVAALIAVMHHLTLTRTRHGRRDFGRAPRPASAA